MVAASAELFELRNAYTTANDSGAEMTVPVIQLTYAGF